MGIDLLPTLRQRFHAGDTPTLFFDHAHPTALGYEIVTPVLAAGIRRVLDLAAASADRR